MKDKILEKLKSIEAAEGIRILYACESGSRAWGFDSKDSDYDVRFIYAKPMDWYLSIYPDSKRDVVEYPLDADNLDASGWDIRKALQLFQKTNPPLLEWLHSPMVYLERGPFASGLRELIPSFYSPVAAAYHYLHMASGNRRDYLKGNNVWLKKYLYVLRPLLAIRWIKQDNGIVPVEFQTLVDTVVPEVHVRKAINYLLDAKRIGTELGRAPAIPALNEFIDKELQTYEEIDLALWVPKAGKYDTEALNTLFRKVIREEL